jgi:hypothetical protein
MVPNPAPSTKITISCSVKSDNLVYGTVNPFVRLYPTIQYTDATTVYPPTAFVAEGTRDWHRISVTVTLDPSKTLSTISVYGYARDFTGTVWFEDFKLEVGTKPTEWTAYAGELFGAKYIFDSNNATFLGGGLVIKNNAGTTVFTADVNGDLEITGKITSTSGQVGGWDITSTSLQTGAYNTSGTRYFGSSGLSISNTFRVTSAGALTATSGTIGGWTINGSAGITKGGVTLDANNERIYVGGSAYLYSYASGVIGISGQLRTTGNITSVGSVNAQGGLGVTDGNTAYMGDTVHVRFGGTLYLLTRDASGFVKATTVVPE